MVLGKNGDLNVKFCFRDPRNATSLRETISHDVQYIGRQNRLYGVTNSPPPHTHKIVTLYAILFVTLCARGGGEENPL